MMRDTEAPAGAGHGLAAGFYSGCDSARSGGGGQSDMLRPRAIILARLRSGHEKPTRNRMKNMPPNCGARWIRATATPHCRSATCSYEAGYRRPATAHRSAGSKRAARCAACPSQYRHVVSADRGTTVSSLAKCNALQGTGRATPGYGYGTGTGISHGRSKS